MLSIRSRIACQSLIQQSNILSKSSSNPAKPLPIHQTCTKNHKSLVSIALLICNAYRSNVHELNVTSDRLKLSSFLLSNILLHARSRLRARVTVATLHERFVRRYFHIRAVGNYFSPSSRMNSPLFDWCVRSSCRDYRVSFVGV